RRFEEARVSLSGQHILVQEGVGQRRGHRTFAGAKGEELLRITGRNRVFGVERDGPRSTYTLFGLIRAWRRIVTPIACLPGRTLAPLGQLWLEDGQGLMAPIAICRFGFFAL